MEQYNEKGREQNAPCRFYPPNSPIYLYAVVLLMFAFDIVPIFDPARGVVLDVFPNLPIVRLAADHVLVIGALPEFPCQALLAAAICGQ